MDLEEKNYKKWIIIAIGIVLIAIIAVGAFLFLRNKSGTTEGTGGVLSFGQLGEDTTRDPITGNNTITGSSTQNGNTDNPADEEPMFRQLTPESVAGITNVVRDGKTYVRYVLRQTGYVYEVNPATGETTQLTNTLIPRIYEAYFGNNGNTVILRHLTLNPILLRDVITTRVEDIEEPMDETNIGKLQNHFGVDSEVKIADDITFVSVSPDGKTMLYLLPVPDGISGTIISLVDKRTPKEIFRNSFSEWLPQLFDNGSILLTTKPSANILGYSYLYDPTTKIMTRLVREKNGLTTMADESGKFVLYSENTPGGSSLSLYSKDALSSEEGVNIYEQHIGLNTLPEKCTWAASGTTIYCGAYNNSKGTQIPDDWYQGLVSFNDSFWKMNTTDLENIIYVADPQKEIQRNFDVTHPLVDKDEKYMIFIDKNDDSLWSLRIPPPIEKIEDSNIDETTTLTPEELKDAVGTTAQ